MSVQKKYPAPVPLFDTLALAFPSTGRPVPVGVVGFKGNDYTRAGDFLYSYRGSSATYNAYRREVERFLAWSWGVAGKSIDAMGRADIEAFVEFCQSPPPAWIGVKHVSRFINQSGARVPNPDWRPYVVRVSKTAHREGFQPDPTRYALSQKG